MAQLTELITQMMGGATARQISRQLGANERATQSAISAALPLLLAALARNSSSTDGASALHDALSRDHDGSILDNLGGFLSNAQDGPGAGILRHVLGDRQQVAQQAVAKASGIDAGGAGQLLVMLAPVVMGALGRAQRQGGLDASGVAEVLSGERDRLGQASPGLMGLAARLLDKDSDGSIADELGGIAGKLFGKR